MNSAKLNHLASWNLQNVLVYLLNYSMEQSPSWKANRFSANQEIPHILWNHKVHYRIYKGTPEPIVSLSKHDQFLRWVVSRCLPYVNRNIVPLAESDIYLSGWQNRAVPKVLESEVKEENAWRVLTQGTTFRSLLFSNLEMANFIWTWFPIRKGYSLSYNTR